jgi:hypothetical protein
MFSYLCWVGLLISGGILIYQDFKTRLISSLLVFIYSLSIIGLFVVRNSGQQLFENAVFCICYLLFCYLILHLYFFIKTNQFQQLLDSKVGWGDILLLISIGSTLSPEYLIYFFTLTFTLTVIFQFVFFKSNKNVPLAGYLLILYFGYLLYGQI